MQLSGLKAYNYVMGANLKLLTCPPNIGPGVTLKFSWTKGVKNGQETLHTGTDHQHAA